jgi:hypothetical protein
MAKLSEDAAVAAIGKVLDDESEYGPEIEGKCNAHIKSKVDRTGPHEKSRCKNPAGSGTDHEGFGPCKLHFGCTPQVRRGAMKGVYEAEFARTIRFGELRPVNPMEGILGEIARTNGFINYLEQQIGKYVRDGESEDVEITYRDGEGGEHVTPEVLLWRAERAHFARCCKMAGDMGVAQAAIELATVMGGQLIELIENVLIDLHLDPDAPEVDRAVRSRLQLLGSTAAA